jgi:hypothetical protein
MKHGFNARIEAPARDSSELWPEVGDGMTG